MRALSGVLIVVASTSILSCSKSKDKAAPVELSGPPLVRQDLKQLDSKLAVHFSNYDRDTNQLFSSVFGGTSADDVRDFIDTRLSYYMSKEELRDYSLTSVDINPHALFNWPPSEDSEDGPGVTRASNYGVYLWLMGLVNGEELTLENFEGKQIEITSSRVGIMEIGPGYTASVPVTGHGKVAMPAAYRQAVLVHEARHSDCTGGISSAEIASLRDIQYMYEYKRFNESSACGHLHSVCESGTFQGIAACDNKPWGPYLLGAIYLEATMDSTSGAQYAVMEYAAAESRSRLDYDLGRLLSYSKEKPDMSSRGAY